MITYLAPLRAGDAHCVPSIDLGAAVDNNVIYILRSLALELFLVPLIVLALLNEIVVVKIFISQRSRIGSFAKHVLSAVWDYS
jgi:hypothetical protein